MSLGFNFLPIPLVIIEDRIEFRPDYQITVEAVNDIVEYLEKVPEYLDQLYELLNL